MSHITCHNCASTEHTSGYGLACGPIGFYTFCECGTLLEFAPDFAGLSEEQVARVNDSLERWRNAVNAIREEKDMPLI